MRKKKKPDDEGTAEMFRPEDIASTAPIPEDPIQGNIWTTQKAQLISRYLYSFLSVTKNGTYIDAFAGPQDVESKHDSWAALRLLERESAFLRRAVLFEEDAEKIPLLEELKQKYCEGFRTRSKRKVLVIHGDCNTEIPKYLTMHRIKPKQAAFALLDQRTHECTWELVKTIADHKRMSGEHKVEIFYFLAQGWMDRSIKSSKQESKLNEIDAWWGNKGWPNFLQLTSWERAKEMESRFKNELGYRFARAFPMRSKANEGRILFWLIHASDHPRANRLMIAAFKSLGLNWSDNTWSQSTIDDLLNRLGPKNEREEECFFEEQEAQSASV